MKNSNKQNGTFVISLDFELLWGVHDHETKESFRQQILGARTAVDTMLKLFDRHQIHATWGIVGMLMAESKEELQSYFPTLKPQYEKAALSSYGYMDDVGADEQNDEFHYAHSLIKKIQEYPNQEIASHTFSHYYCKQPGQTKETFEADLYAAQRIAKEKFGVELKSLILPRNHFVGDYIESACKAGFCVVRGNPKSFAYNKSSMLARAFRFVDTYIGICGRKTYVMKADANIQAVNVKASTFFRKYNTRLAFFEKYKVAHIKREMKYAAKNGEVYHLWWHPHNVGENTALCMAQLGEIFAYYQTLQEKYGFDSKTMYEAAEEIRNENSDVM